jgi:hypothetical protein
MTQLTELLIRAMGLPNKLLPGMQTLTRVELRHALSRSPGIGRGKWPHKRWAALAH